MIEYKDINLKIEIFILGILLDNESKQKVAFDLLHNLIVENDCASIACGKLLTVIYKISLRITQLTKLIANQKARENNSVNFIQLITEVRSKWDFHLSKLRGVHVSIANEFEIDYSIIRDIFSKNESLGV